MAAESFAFLYTVLKPAWASPFNSGLCAFSPFWVPVHVLCFDWVVSSICAGLNSTTSFTGGKTLRYPFDFRPLMSWWSYFPLLWHYPPTLQKNPKNNPAVAEAAASLTQLWELLCEREGTSVGAARPSGLLLSLFMFLLLRYPWRRHEQRVCFVQNIVRSLPLVPHPDQIPPQNRWRLWIHPSSPFFSS